jgi:putative transposase
VTWGYLRVWVKLRREGWRVNKKRVHRLYKQEGLCVGRHKPRRGRHRSAVARPKQTKATRERKLVDGLHGRSAVRRSEVRGGRLLTLVDDFSRESLTIDLDQRLTGERVAAILDRVARERGLPEKIRVDNGSEFTGRVLDQWAYVNNVRLDFSRRGKPTDNGLIEAFNGWLRAECLNENWFMSIDDAREKVEVWRRHYNEERPHNALGNLSPREFAASNAQEYPAG